MICSIQQKKYCSSLFFFRLKCLTIFQGTGRMFSLGLGLQVALKLVLNLPTIVKSPGTMKNILFRKQNLNLAMFLGFYNGIFRVRSIFFKDILRRRYILNIIIFV